MDKYIVEGNKKIAKFMGAKTARHKTVNALMWVCEGYHLHNKLYFPNNLKYHKSWDWLMPVIFKIESLGYRFTIQSYQAQVWDKNPSKEDIDTMGDLAGFIIDADFHEDEMENAYDAVVSFIENYT